MTPHLVSRAKKGTKEETMNTDEKHKESCDAKRNKFKELKIDGPFMSEPDKVHWKHEGMDCLIVRNFELFHFCGYVGVKQEHPYYGKHYDDVPLPDNAHPHGGLTFAGHCHGVICHNHNSHEKDKIWWLGFDFAHAEDALPGMLIARATIPALKKLHDESPIDDRDVYRTFEYVKAEVEQFASFLKNAL